MDVVTVRNIRVNQLANGLKVDGVLDFQVKVIVYFTYEKVGMELYAKLLGIS